jgi:negative regulator of sigma E activity
MPTNHEVISAFLDDEPFEAQVLAEALADPAGRALLIDFVLLRHVAQSEESAGGVMPTPALRSKRPPYLVAAAAVLVALVGGYQLGQRQSPDDSPRPPAATRIVQSEPVWQELGGVR